MFATFIQYLIMIIGIVALVYNTFSHFTSDWTGFNDDFIMHCVWITLIEVSVIFVEVVFK